MHKTIRSASPEQTRRQRLLLASAVAAVGITTSACGSNGAATSVHAGSANSARSGDPVAVTTLATKFGIILAGPHGRSVYLFEKDLGTTSSCRDTCASLWPPVTAGSAPSVSGLAHRALLGTTRRDDGIVQVTYAEHPLYYFVGDHAAGDVTGEGLDDFGATWYAVTANGRKISNEAA